MSNLNPAGGLTMPTIPAGTPMLPADIQGQVKSIAMKLGLDPDKVWAAWQAGGTPTKLPTTADVKKLKVPEKLGESQIVQYFVSKGVDKTLATNALKWIGMGGVQQTPDNIMRVLTTYAQNGTGSDKAKATAYLTSDVAVKNSVVPAPTNAPGVKPGDAGFDPSKGVAGGTVDDAYLQALRNQAKNFLTNDQINFLTTIGGPNTAGNVLAQIAGPGGSDEAALAMNKLAQTTGAQGSGLPYEGDLTASQTEVQLDKGDTSDWGIDPIEVPQGSRAPRKSKWIDPNEPLHGGKTVAQALKMLRDLPQDQLINLQRKLVDSGYIARTAPGNATEPDAWGDPTDPNTNAAWRALLVDSIAQGTDVTTLLATGTTTWAPKLAEMNAAIAKQKSDEALAEALRNQVQVSSMDSLRSALSKITNHGQLLGHDLTPDEVTNMGQWIQGLQTTQQRAEKAGSSFVPQVDVGASLEQKAIAEHPVDYLGQQTAVAAETWARLLKTPGSA